MSHKTYIEQQCEPVILELLEMEQSNWKGSIILKSDYSTTKHLALSHSQAIRIRDILAEE